MTEATGISTWRFVHFGLLVTGKGEERFIPDFLHSLTASGRCTFEVIRKVEQLSPRAETVRTPNIVGTGKGIPNKDAERIGFPARNYLQKNPNAFVLLVDDLERDRAGMVEQVFGRYSRIFDGILGVHRRRASVHFLVNMLEAYYFAEPEVVEAVLGIQLRIPLTENGDVEFISHPKNELKRQFVGFDEVEHGARIVNRLDLRRILADPKCCGFLRSLVAWCVAALEESSSDYSLESGIHAIVTGRQLQQHAAGNSQGPR